MPDVGTRELHEDCKHCRENGTCVGRNGDRGTDYTAVGPVDPEARVDVTGSNGHIDGESVAGTLPALRDTIEWRLAQASSHFLT